MGLIPYKNEAYLDWSDESERRRPCGPPCKTWAPGSAESYPRDHRRQAR